MGALGGPNNCLFPEIIPPKISLTDLTMYGDVWGSEIQGLPPFGVPYRRGWLGFKYAPEEGWYAMKGDADRMGLDDLIQITPYGDAWVSLSLETTNQTPNRWGWLGFRYEEAPHNGWYTLAGDPNGDGASDLIQVTPYGDVWVALSSESSYGEPSRWGWLGFRYAPYDGWYPLCGDMNADGCDDLVQITPTGDPWVSLSAGAFFTEPERWGWLNFFYDENLGYYPLLGDVNSDGREDLILITPDGRQWISLSQGHEFESPEEWGYLGFIWSREMKYLPMFLNF